MASSRKIFHIGSNPLGSRKTKLLILNTKTAEVSSNGFNQIIFKKGQNNNFIFIEKSKQFRKKKISVFSLVFSISPQGMR